MSCLSVEEWNYHAQVDPRLVQQVVQEVMTIFPALLLLDQGLDNFIALCTEVQLIS